MLPFDNKDEFLVVADLPEDTPLQATERALTDLASHLATVAEVDNCVTFAGVTSPMDFNGLVRHYFIKRAPWVGEIRVNLADKHRRRAGSHAIALRVRPALEEIARRHQVRMKIVEMPPGPPVLQTLVGEVTGPPGAAYAGIIAEARKIEQFFRETPGVVDIDTSVPMDQPRWRFVIDRDKAALSGLSQAQIARSLAIAQAGEVVGRVHADQEVLPLEIFLRWPVADRSSTANLGQVYLKSPDGRLVPLGELGTFTLDTAPKSIMRKNLERLVLVMGDTAGASPVNAILTSWARWTKIP
jgi:multidrug efflux pump subunit AcrB